MGLRLESFELQNARWPSRGRHILAQSDAESVVVYQAFRETIATHAVEHQKFGGDFSYSRMSWIKPNFLWMMFRSGWATKEGQERILAVRMRRSAFLAALRQSVHSKYVAEVYGSPAAWKERGRDSDVRLQWDPDHGLAGQPLERRAIQLGLSGETLRAYGEADALSIEDVTAFVHEQREHVKNRALSRVELPREEPFVIDDAKLREHLGLDPAG